MKPTKTRLHTTGLTLAAGALALAGTMASADVVHPDDVIIQGSACVGFDCNNGENFGFDTIRMKENNLRLHFDDTSNSSSFPDNDWRLIANDTSNGGAEYLAIEDSSAGRQVFRVTAGARTNSIFVSSSGNVGFGTATPSVTLHARTGNTPTLRLEQDGSSGFTPQTWDLAGNEANFFVRDATNGSTLPFRIQPGAATNALYIAEDDNIGIGAGTNPSASLHVRRTNGTAQILVEDTGASGSSTMFRLTSNARPIFEFENLSVASDEGLWRASSANNGDFEINNVGVSGAIPVEFDLDKNGNLTLSGTLTTATTTYPDYVFAQDYDLMPLTDVRAFITENGHLPNVPSADEIIANGLNLTEMHIKLMEKVEELTLYTLAQEERIDALQQELDTLRN